MIQPKISPENNISTSLQNQFLIATLVGMAFLAVMIGVNSPEEKEPLEKKDASHLTGAFFIEPGLGEDSNRENFLLSTYGLVYELLEAGIPVTWIPNGQHTSVDLSERREIFATKAFMVAQSDITPVAIEILQRWESMGTYGSYVSHEVGSPVQFRLTHFPKVAIGPLLVEKINGYYESAGIPTDGYYLIQNDDPSIFAITDFSTQESRPVDFPFIPEESGVQVYFDFLFSQAIAQL